MAVFTTNQVRQFYVVSGTLANNQEPTVEGQISACKDADGKIYFKYYGKGGRLRSDIIDPKNITSIKHTKASNQVRNRKKAVVTLADDTTLTIGQDYVIRVKVLGHYTLASEPAVFQFGVVRATKAMTEDISTFYAKLAESLNANVNKGEETLLTITSSEDGLVIEEVAQTKNYKRGEYSVKPVNFEVFCSEVNACVNADAGIYEVMPWGKVEYTTATENPVPNSYAVADMEHFYMGERGDIYRNTGRNSWDTEYMVNPTHSAGYDILDIHFAYTDQGTSSYRSEKDITIVSGADNIHISTLKTNLEALLNPTTEG